MRVLLHLFGHSPFSSLREHMQHVVACVDKLRSLFEALEKKEYDAIESISKEISYLEHRADIVKNDLRNHLPMRLLMPINRASLLEILSIQDHLADLAEDVGILLTLRPLPFEENFRTLFWPFFDNNFLAFEKVQEVMETFTEVIQSTFGGNEAKKLRDMISDLARIEHETDIKQRPLLKHLFTKSDHLPAPSFSLWLKVLENLSAISNSSERLGNRIRMTLDIK